MEQLQLLRFLLKKFDEKITEMVKLQAHIHQILNTINKRKMKTKTVPNENKDYFVEHIFL